MNIIIIVYRVVANTFFHILYLHITSVEYVLYYGKIIYRQITNIIADNYYLYYLLYYSIFKKGKYIYFYDYDYC